MNRWTSKHGSSTTVNSKPSESSIGGAMLMHSFHLVSFKEIGKYYFYAYDPASGTRGFGFFDYTWNDHSMPYPTLGHAKAALASFELEGLL
jgi:hypothetical protein